MDILEETEVEEIVDMWCGEEWHHFGHYWTDYYGMRWYCGPDNY